MVDPSLLLSAEGSAWFVEDSTFRSHVVVAGTAMQWLQGEVDVNPARLLSPEDSQVYDERRRQLLPLMSNVPTFSYTEVAPQLDPAHNAVLRNLLQDAPTSELAVNRLYADEWAFLQSQSMLISKLRRPLDAFRDAGSAVVEFGRRVGWRMVQRVIPEEHLPPTLTGKLMVRATVKWIVLGGAAIGGGTLGAMVGTAVGGPIGGTLGHKAAGVLAEEAAHAAVVAIDP
jgi:hypothetical protein